MTQREPSGDFGAVTWISTDGNEGPDEGITFGLGSGRYFFVGPISRELWKEHGSPLWPDASGWWLVTGPDMIPMARFVTVEDAKEFMNELALMALGRKLGNKPGEG